MSNNRVGGIIQLTVNGSPLSAKGDFTYNIGAPKREAVVGADAVHGFSETPQVPFIEGEFTDRAGIKLSDIVNIVDATVMLRLANGKLIVLRDAWFAGEGTGNTKEGNIGCRFEARDAEEIA